MDQLTHAAMWYVPWNKGKLVGPHLSTRQYARIVRGWVREIGLDSSDY
jgi:hypothetical protein